MKVWLAINIPHTKSVENARGGGGGIFLNPRYLKGKYVYETKFEFPVGLGIRSNAHKQIQFVKAALQIVPLVPVVKKTNCMSQLTFKEQGVYACISSTVLIVRLL